MTIELWKDIENYKGFYQVSDYGQIKRIENTSGTYIGRILKPQIYHNKYLYVTLCKNTQKKKLLIHRLVLEAFVGFCPSGLECRHLDGNRQNNKLNNLKWGTRSENQYDSIKHGTRFQPDNHGSKQWLAKLTDNKVKEIKHLLMSGVSQIQIAKQFHVCPTTISRIATGKTWKHI